MPLDARRKRHLAGGVSETCRFRKLCPIDSRSANRNMIAACLQSASCSSACCAIASSHDSSWVVVLTRLRLLRVEQVSRDIEPAGNRLHRLIAGDRETIHIAAEE
jgi:hypothetical protein